MGRVLKEIPVGTLRAVEALNRYEKQKGFEYTLVTTDQDCAAFADVVPNWQDYGCFFVNAFRGEYLEIWGCTTSTPWFNATVEKLYSKTEFDRALAEKVAENSKQDQE